MACSEPDRYEVAPNVICNARSIKERPERVLSRHGAISDIYRKAAYVFRSDLALMGGADRSSTSPGPQQMSHRLTNLFASI